MWTLSCLTQNLWLYSNDVTGTKSQTSSELFNSLTNEGIKGEIKFI